jgi:hypothetical protein
MSRLKLLTPAIIGLLMLATPFKPNAQDGEPKPADGEIAKVDQATRRAEGEKLLKNMRDWARVAWAKAGDPKQLTGEVRDGGCGVKADDLKGANCNVRDKVYAAKKGSAALVAEENGGGGFALLVFRWKQGVEDEIKWYDTIEALNKAIEETADGNKEAEGKEGKDADKAGADDPYMLYKKVGRSWTIKNVIKIEGFDDNVSYTKTEVVKVTENDATYKMTMLDADKKPYAGMEPMELSIKFVVPGATSNDAPKIETKDETIKVEAGEFECTLTEMAGIKTWMSKKYPGLMVTSEHASGYSELIEFKE